MALRDLGVDLVLLYDTGSTDATRDIAARFNRTDGTPPGDNTNMRVLWKVTLSRLVGFAKKRIFFFF